MLRMQFMVIILSFLALACDSQEPKNGELLVIDEAPMEQGMELAECPEPEPTVCEECPICEMPNGDAVPRPEVEVDDERLDLNLLRDSDNLYAWRKTRASLDPEADVVFYWSGYIYNVVEKDPADYQNRGSIDFADPLFRFEGFNVARFAQDGPNDYMMLSREVSVYQDPRTGRIIDCWTNTLTPERQDVRVMHVANDPVNFGVGAVSYVELGDRISFFSDILLSYRSPLAGADQYERFSASDVYQSNELFNFIVSRDDLENEDVLSAPVEISWTRIGQYLPWMQMGDRPGHLIYHVRGYKVLGGVSELPGQLLDWTRNTAGERFLRSPEFVPQSYQPNATSWRVFRDALDSGAYSSECR